ncbi:MAG: thioredoxin domain-containing protein [Verrucomicrobiota bacterium]
MKSWPWFTPLGVAVLVTACWSNPARGQAPQAAPSVQEQIEALKAGQERLLAELKELKALLKGRTARSEYAARPATPDQVVSVNVHGEPFKGDPASRVAIIEYSDFDCGHCAQHSKEVLPRIDASYIKTGKVRYFFRDLPEAGNTGSSLKARAARCAGEQGKFWEMHDRLFAAQPSLEGDELAREAQSLGLDGAKLAACVSSGRFAENIRRSGTGAARMGIHGTPAFMVGTVTDDGDIVRVVKVFLGAESWETFQELLDGLLRSPPKE